MKYCKVYLDESGDLGWKFDKPVFKGGSSRFLTIAFVICDESQKGSIRLKRSVQAIKKSFDTTKGEELKAAHLSQQEKNLLASKVANVLLANQNVKIGYITVYKPNVLRHIREDSNKLYNYMIKLALLQYVEDYDQVTLIRDNRSIKIKSGNSLIEYLQTELWFEREKSTVIIDVPSDSKAVRNLEFADWINNLVWANYERQNKEPYDLLAPHISGRSHKLFFY